jgi:hypothetical protein
MGSCVKRIADEYDRQKRQVLSFTLQLEKGVVLPNMEYKMLPNRLYEVLPYIYISTGALAMSLLGHFVAVISGLILIVAGALVWILRSDHRRGDLNHSSAHHGAIPFWLYELQPFVYATGGLLLWQLSSNQYLYPSALILIVVGLQIWLMRNSQRKHQLPNTNRASI